MTVATQAELIDRARRGDRGALGQVLRGQQDRLFNLAFRMVSDRDDAAEVTQQAMLKAVDQLDRFRGEAQFTTWLRQILVNEAFSLLRRRRTRQRHHAGPSSDGRPHHADDERADIVGQLPATGEPGPAQRVQQREAVELLQTAIEGLDEIFRAVLVLRDIEQLDYQQIGTVLELPAGTVKSRLFRARLQLREQLETLGYDGPGDERY
jgi:RNA polymerase sigma-70 factor (ECF subfamily)